MVRHRRLWRFRLGFYMSVAAGLVYTGFTFLFARFLSWTSLLLVFATAVLFGALLVRLGGKVIGGFIVAGFGFLWWYFGLSAPHIALWSLSVNLRSPLGIICSAAMLLGLGAGAVDIAEAVLAE